MSAVHTHIQSDLEFREVSLPHHRSDISLLFIHGMSHRANFYDEAMTHLALNDGIACASVSLEGHGDSPLTNGRTSINQLGIEDYKRNVLKAIDYLASSGREVVPVFHSLSGRCGFELLYEGRFPETVKAVHLLAPVPSQGTYISALTATWGDLLRSGRLTPLNFAVDLIRGDVEHFMTSDPEMIASLFFSSDKGGENRILKLNPQEFTGDYLGAESNRAIAEVILPSRVKVSGTDIPVLIMASENDRVIRSADLRRMAGFMRGRSGGEVTFKLYKDISHEMPMDIALNRVMGDMVSWLKGRGLV